MLSKRRSVPQMLLRSLWFVALAAALSFRFERPAPVATSHGEPSVVASLVAASKVATLSAGAKTAKVSPAPLLKRVATRIDSASVLPASHARTRTELGSPSERHSPSFPLILRVLHRIPRLGAEEPPWSAQV